MKCSCIDIGSNTVKISVFERCGRHWKSVGYLGEQTQLIKYVELKGNERVLSEDGKNALFAVLERLVSFSNSKACEHIFAFATASLRGVSNSEEIEKLVYERFSIHLDVLTGEEEAICSLKGLLLDEKCEGIKSGIMIDMGGGSTEVVYFENGKDPKIVSLDFGCLSLTDEYIKDFPPSTDGLNALRRCVREKMVNCSFAKCLNVPVFLIGGTARAAVRMASELIPRKKDIFKPSDFLEIAQGMVSQERVRSTAERLIPKRVRTITAGCGAYFELFDFIKPSEIHVSESGVREGYLERILV